MCNAIKYLNKEITAMSSSLREEEVMNMSVEHAWGWEWGVGVEKLAQDSQG